MASTNKTTYFELSQFIGSDHPTWLSDVNGDMLKIDTALQSIKATAEHADSLAESGAINIQDNTSDISDLQDAVTGLVAKMGSGSLTNLGGNVSGALGNTSIAEVGNSVSEAIVALKALADGLVNRFNFTDSALNSVYEVTSGAVDFTDPTQTGSVNGFLRYALNSDKSAGKIYGNIQIINFIATGGRIEIDTGITVKRPSSPFNILGISGMWSASAVDGIRPVTNPMIQVKADGTIHLSILCSNAAQTYNWIYLYFPACIYFFSDFGD